MVILKIIRLNLDNQIAMRAKMEKLSLRFYQFNNPNKKYLNRQKSLKKYILFQFRIK